MRFIRLVALGLCAVPLAFASESARTHLAARPNLTKPLDRPVPGPHDSSPVTPEEWVKIEAWMRQNCPNRLLFFNRMSDTDGQKEHAKQLIAERYRQIEHIAYKPLQDAMVSEAQAQDQIFGAQIKLRAARRGHEGPEKLEAKNELRKAVGNLIDAEVAEKGARVSHLQGEIAHLKNNKNNLVDEWTRGMMKRVEASADGKTPSGPDTENSSPSETDSPIVR
jgi:hypothetical protein